jgi:hypothetical protein
MWTTLAVLELLVHPNADQEERVEAAGSARQRRDRASFRHANVSSRLYSVVRSRSSLRPLSITRRVALLGHGMDARPSATLGTQASHAPLCTLPRHSAHALHASCGLEADYPQNTTLSCEAHPFSPLRFVSFNGLFYALLP